MRRANIVEKVHPRSLKPLEIHAIVDMVETVVISPGHLVALHTGILHTVSFAFCFVDQFLDPGGVGVETGVHESAGQRGSNGGGCDSVEHVLGE